MKIKSQTVKLGFAKFTSLINLYIATYAQCIKFNNGLQISITKTKEIRNSLSASKDNKKNLISAFGSI